MNHPAPDQSSTLVSSIDASTIILGFTGPIGSGSTYVANSVMRGSNITYSYFKLSDIIRSEFEAEGNHSPTTDQLQTKGNELRRTGGRGYLVKKLIETIHLDEEKLQFISNNPQIIIDGIKNEEEINVLKAFPYFFLFSVHADFYVRSGRTKTIFTSTEIFKIADDRDRFEKDDIFGQQVKKCNYRSDIIILNEKNIPVADTLGMTEFDNRIYSNYVRLIENSRNHGKPITDVTPSVAELSMTMAYSVSSMSSCLKRKVGAILVDEIKTKTVGPLPRGMISSMPVVVSTGYNEVPVGAYKCAFNPDIEMCYRDYLQEDHARKIKHCPGCGAELNYSMTCPHCNDNLNTFKKYCKAYHQEIEDDFVCPKCKTKVFKEYLPGEKATPGKLLDMCRALHAEENALLHMIKNNNRFLFLESFSSLKTILTRENFLI